MSFIDVVYSRKERNICVKKLSVGLFGPEDEEEMYVFRRAVEDANIDLKRTQWNLTGEVIFLDTYDSFNLSNLSKFVTDCKIKIYNGIAL